MADPVHGFTVKAEFKTEGGGGVRPGRIILVDRGERYTERWVSTWQADGDNEWSQGNYYSEFAEARDHFLERCSREEVDRAPATS